MPQSMRRLLRAAVVAVVVLLFSAAAQHARAALDAAQQAATLAFLQEFRDEIPYLSTRWTGTDYCSWEGITCDGAGNVYIDLSNKGLSGNMPELNSAVDGSQVMVTSIDMSNNPNWNDDFESSWSRLVNLRYLDLSNTALRGYIPDAWTNMAALETVYISNTYACRTLPNWNIPSLSILDLSNNAFSGSLPASWGSMANLASVDISGAFPCGCVPATWTSSALTSAAAAVGSGVSDANCATVNTCVDNDDNHCLNYRAAAASLTLKQRHTLSFLEEFPLDLPYLSTRWTGVDYCSWEGITCDADGHVSIDLSNKDLTGEVPQLHSYVDGWQVQVVSIDMSNNLAWSNSFQQDWGNLKNLVFLNLSYTALNDDIPDDWNGMRSVEEVHITNTGACKSLPDWTLAKLRVVDFSNNHLQGSLSSTWSQMSSLTSVDISGNNFCGCVPTTWTSTLLTNAATAAGGELQSATCATSNVCTMAALICLAAPTPTDAPATAAPTTDATLTFLRLFPAVIPGLASSWTGTDYCSWEGITCDANGFATVDLSGKSLTGQMPAFPEHIQGSQVKVTSIDMSNNPSIVSNFQDSWAALTNLVSLDLSSTGLYGAIPDAWNGMTSLQSVKITNTNACKSLPNWNIASLRTVDLSNNQMHGALANSWSDMTGLTSVDIRGNGFCGCMPSSWVSQVLVNAATAANSAMVAANCFSTRFCTDADYVCANQPAPTAAPTTSAPQGCSVANCAACLPGSSNMCSVCNSGYTLRDDGSCMMSGQCSVENCTQCSPTDYNFCQICNAGYSPTTAGRCRRGNNGAAAPTSMATAAVAALAAAMMVAAS